MKIKNEVLKNGGKVAYKLDVGDGQFSVSEMPAEVAAEIIAKGKKGEDVNGYMKIDERHYFPIAVIDVEEKDAPEKVEAPAKEGAADSDKSVKKG